MAPVRGVVFAKTEVDKYSMLSVRSPKKRIKFMKRSSLSIMLIVRYLFYELTQRDKSALSSSTCNETCPNLIADSTVVQLIDQRLRHGAAQVERQMWTSRTPLSSRPREVYNITRTYLLLATIGWCQIRVSAILNGSCYMEKYSCINCRWPVCAAI